jgi:hypothetical protein
VAAYPDAFREDLEEGNLDNLGAEVAVLKGETALRRTVDLTVGLLGDQTLDQMVGLLGDQTLDKTLDQMAD